MIFNSRQVNSFSYLVKANLFFGLADTLRGSSKHKEVSP